MGSLHIFLSVAQILYSYNVVGMIIVYSLDIQKIFPSITVICHRHVIV